jgi:HlyD family secretion protein
MNMRRSFIIAAAAGVLALVIGFVWWRAHRASGAGALVLHGNVDLRQVELAFNNSERIASVLVEEGDRVKKGQVLARLDTSRLEPQVAQAEAQAAAQRDVVERLHHGNRPDEIAQSRAQVAAQQHVVDKLHHGSRPEEIAQAKANVDSAQADLVNARRQYERYKVLTPKGAATQQDLDNAKAALDVAEAKLAVNQKAWELAELGPRQEEIQEAEATLAANQRALDLAVEGPRKEDIAQAEAQLKANEAQVALLRQMLADAELIAPTDAIVRTRILEPGEMSSPQRPVLSLAVVDPKWIRAYVSEPDLGKLHPRMPATVVVDSFPNRQFDGWVGFISPVAEFTPKTVQTDELRTSLVYEVRVFVKDPTDDLRLGMPASVVLDTSQTQPSPLAASSDNRPTDTAAEHPTSNSDKR